MAEPWSASRMYQLGVRHATFEARCDLEGTLATLVVDPIYEFHPLGLKMEGGAQVRRYYLNLFENFIPRTQGYQLLSEWVNEASVAQEYEIAVDVDGGIERHRVIGILFVDGERLGGERVYASERMVRLMVGDLFDELEPIG